ncbi:MAG: hypothetical protein KDB02_00105 [Acidimicrobiales bacterium]|nr:hypothetical protein [Acidimicrobiales bacterium]
MSLSRAESIAVVGDLRRARRRQRVAEIHWIDAMYQVYITGIIAVVALMFLSSLIGDGQVSASVVADVKLHGPAVCGLVAALALFVGLRSGSRGGPLALERPDVRHVLLAPVDRGVALRGPAWRQLRFGCFVGAAVGAGAGQLALRRLPGNQAEWMFFGALFGVCVFCLSFGSALVASGVKLPSWVATIGGGALVAWSVADIAGRAPTSPATHVGSLPLWPLHTDAVAIVGVVAALVLVGLGMATVAGTSLEAAERRTSLVGQLRFAVTLQDLRTVMVLRRQLAQERPRSRPWIPARSGHPRFPVFQRGLRSTLRWPIGRLGRFAVLIVVAGLALRGVWAGTTPLVIVAGLALWLAALDAAEPLGQEVDHPGRTDTFPFERGRLFVRHLPIIFVVAAITGLLAGVVTLLPGTASVPAGEALIVGVMASVLAACGAVVSVVQGAPEAVDSMAMTTPEIAGMRTVYRAAWPPGMAVIGTLPLIAARAAAERAARPTAGTETMAPIAAAVLASLPLLLLVALVAGWTRFHDQIHAWIAEAMEQASPTKAAERASAEREERERAALARIEAEKAAKTEEAAKTGGAVKAAPKTRPKAGPPPAAKSKPKPSAPPKGVQGGKSAKPIGRRRDQEPS